MTRDQALQIADDLEAAGAQVYQLMRAPSRTTAIGEVRTTPSWQVGVTVHNRPDSENVVRAAFDAYRHRVGVERDAPGVPVTLNCGSLVIG